MLLIQLPSLHLDSISGVKYLVALPFIVSLPTDLLDPNVNQKGSITTARVLESRACPHTLWILSGKNLIMNIFKKFLIVKPKSQTLCPQNPRPSTNSVQISSRTQLAQNRLGLTLKSQGPWDSNHPLGLTLSTSGLV